MSTAFFLLKYIDRLYVFIFFRLLWAGSTQKKVQILERFGDIEDDTSWQIKYSLSNITNDQVRSSIFYQLLEEAFHAEEFYRLVGKMGGARTSHKGFERSILYSSKEDAWKLLVYCFVGEAEAAIRFENILRVIDKGEPKNVIAKIVSDEQGHVNLAINLLKRMGIPEAQAKREIVRVFIERRLNGLGRNIRTAFGALTVILLSGLYFSLGIFSVRSSKRQLDGVTMRKSEGFKRVIS